MIPRIPKKTSQLNDDALAAFVARKTEIDVMRKRRQALSDDHFGVVPEEITWGHVGTLEHHAELLKRITGSACCHGATKAPRHASPFNEGEHAA